MPQAISLLTTLFITLALQSCIQVKGLSTKQKQEKVIAIPLATTIETSPFAKFFLSDLQQELKEQQKSLEDYVPTKALMDKYGVRLFNHVYLVQGFITTNDRFDLDRIKKLGISTGKPLGNKMTVSIPLSSLADFLNLPGVDYFEMNPKASLQH